MTPLEDFRQKYPQYDGMEDSELAARLHAKFYKDVPITEYVKKVGVDVGKYDPAKGMTQFEKFTAGAGKAVSDIGQGVSQMLGKATTSDVAETRKRDAPLMATTAGKAGNIAGDIAVAAPAALIPGAGTALGAAAIGGALGASQPVAEGESRGLNTALGAGLGVAGKAIGDVASKGLTKLVSKNVANTANKKAALEPMQKAVTEAQQSGYRLPPSQANPSLLNKILEGIGGKIKTGQAASTFNQENTNKLVKQAMGLSADRPVTPEALEGIRKEAGKAYDALRTSPAPFQATPEYQKSIQSLGKEWKEAAAEFPELVKNEKLDTLITSLDRPAISPNAAVQIIRKLRFDAKANLKGFDAPEKLALGRAQQKAATAMEDMIEANLEKSGNPELVQNFKQARQLIAKSYDVESALNEATGNVSARKLAKLLDKGKPLTGELRQAARFAKAFPKAAQDVETIGSQPAISPLDVGAGVIGAGTAHSPAAGLAMAARPGIRAGILSKPYQKAFAKPPDYRPSKTLRGAAETAQRLKRPAPYALSEVITDNRDEK